MRPTDIDLAHAVVAITGAGRGIGRATAEAFAARGATVCIGDLDAEAAGDAAGQIGRRVHGFTLDVTDAGSFADFVTAAEEMYGPIDVLVNNAGIMPAGRFLDEPAKVTDAIIDVNLRGPIHGMKLVLPGMIDRGRGHMVAVASGLGRFEVPGLATYCASKHGAVGLSATVARELEGSGVTVTVVLPSAVHTELSSGIAFPFERIAKVTPEQVADAIVASCDSRPREVWVPRWMRPYPPLAQLLPRRLERIVRRAFSADDRALDVDATARSAYVERIARQTTASPS